MSGVCGVFCPQKPELATAEIMAGMLAAIEHRGETVRHFVDEGNGLAVGYRFRPNFVAQSETALPGWYEDEDLVVAIDGSIVSGKPGEASTASPDTANRSALRDAYVSSPRNFAAEADGIYDFVIWDRSRQQLWLSGDRVASKPFYYYFDQVRSLLIFASQAKAIYAHPAVPMEVDPASLSIYLAASNLPPPLGLIKGAKRFSRARSFLWISQVSPRSRATGGQTSREALSDH